MNDTKPLCLYHAQCDDGFAAAWCVHAALGPTALEFYPATYQEEPPDVRDRDVIMVDFSYKRPVLEAMIKSCRTLLVLDHHRTAAEDLAFLPEAFFSLWDLKWRNLAESDDLPKATAVFDMKRSGAGLAWDFFHSTPRPAFINYIEDRDLWRKQLPNGDAFSFALRSYPQDFDTWSALIAAGPESLIDEAAPIQRYYRLRVEEMKQNAYRAMLCGHEIRIANAPRFAASEVAGELAEGADFGASYFERGPGLFEYSLRSRSGVDVSEIAKRFGGGGHAAAAGFTVATPVHTPA